MLYCTMKPELYARTAAPGRQSEIARDCVMQRAHHVKRDCHRTLRQDRRYGGNHPDSARAMLMLSGRLVKAQAQRFRQIFELQSAVCHR
jgi:hypothetical protein